MSPELPQPYSQEDIRKDPKAVVIGLLIGLLLIFGGVIGVLYNRKEQQTDDCSEKIDSLYFTIIKERNKRIDTYEAMIFYKKKSDSFEEKEKKTKELTQPLVTKALQQ
ncbi:hypothetical protein I6H88_04260 [Elizabethkingia bruuniana]|uniref:Uncharacterized protein n=1 Tax=Elizabethkingia bruuniana TaxID=1756149 RepID=A0A7T7V0W1_9FLAO|nr:hypothetical protein [Elizabethkingia bruuniana]KGO09704.1 hypothetical protein KS04_13295 [Elizabethkingia miricola]MDV3604989.1 hypothetical protein [Elizabethkingia anophelis]AQX86547.1 hypothetical protein AYC65_16725 [Elizabethkingia bruuniana]KUY26588.1 hypothetical protein ATB97_19440 [Elizabethkingia bruuniana]OPB65728.1 hypothetical protein BAY12_14980 [Elizabethkingia bruuniana]